MLLLLRLAQGQRVFDKAYLRLLPIPSPRLVLRLSAEDPITFGWCKGFSVLFEECIAED